MSLGIDIGTTSIKICLNLPTQSNNIMSLRISGQMHGIMLWNSSITRKVEKYSNLITWMDERCDENFILEIKKQIGEHLKISKGYGLATLLWLTKYKLDYVKEFNRCGTIMDFICCYLKNNFDETFITDQNAVSWGLFNEIKNNFDLEILSKIFPNNFFNDIITLPKVIEANYLIGKTTETFSIFGIPNDIQIKASLGDLQASLSIVSIKTPVLFIIIGTSAQISFILPDTLDNVKNLQKNNLLIRNKFIPNFSAWTGALMNGGNTLEKIVNLICNLYFDIVSLDDDEKQKIKEKVCWEKLLNIQPNINQLKTNSLSFEKLFLEERSNEIVQDKHLHNGLVVFAYKIVENMHNIISTTTLFSMGISKMILIGKANTPLFKNLIMNFYKNQSILELKDLYPNSISIDSSLGSAVFDEVIFSNNF
ncbi:Sedoheptulokinase [Strongyloides ratti]|uniref:Sedoheptulokinase n=1 Tax=Strongyloides ratti TaxID=34506 RepID=A0A090LQE4_STRRB|nr:Sedoheptulokinase [Strongyloides ratti]CEF70406.2 Sedoheptulokinase [Strongyloides ratti]